MTELRVLLVEANEAVFFRFLKAAGAIPEMAVHVDWAASFAAASGQLSEQAYQLIFLGVEEDPAGAYRFMDELKARPSSPGFVIVGHYSVRQMVDRLAQRAIQAGAVGWIDQDNLNPEHLKRVLRLALAIQRLPVDGAAARRLIPRRTEAVYVR